MADPGFTGGGYNRSTVSVGKDTVPAGGLGGGGCKPHQCVHVMLFVLVIDPDS